MTLLKCLLICTESLIIKEALLLQAGSTRHSERHIRWAALNAVAFPSVIQIILHRIESLRHIRRAHLTLPSAIRLIIKTERIRRLRIIDLVAAAHWQLFRHSEAVLIINIRAPVPAPPRPRPTARTRPIATTTPKTNRPNLTAFCQLPAHRHLAALPTAAVVSIAAGGAAH